MLHVLQEHKKKYGRKRKYSHICTWTIFYLTLRLYGSLYVCFVPCYWSSGNYKDAQFDDGCA